MTYGTEILKLEKRNRQIVKLRESGLSMDKIAIKFGISRQRVAYILNREKK